MKKKTKITLTAATLMVLSLTIIMPQEAPQQPEARPVPKGQTLSALADDSRGNTPPQSVEHQRSKAVPSPNDQSGTQNEPMHNAIQEQDITSSDNMPQKPTEKEEVPDTPIPITQTATKPPAPVSAEPKMGDTRIIDGKKQSYFLGFGWVDDMGENECTFAEDMYENGNKIGSMGGGTVVGSDGDINKMVGIMD